MFIFLLISQSNDKNYNNECSTNVCDVSYKLIIPSTICTFHLILTFLSYGFIRTDEKGVKTVT